MKVRDCGKGHYQQDTNENFCYDCPAGTSSPAKSTLESQCTSCNTGYKSSLGSTCVACPAGQTSNSLHTSCISCPTGEISTSSGRACEECPAGETSNSAHTACVTCDAGTFSVEGGACQMCPAGTSSTAGQANSCSICPAGKASSDGQADKCTPCSPGSYSGEQQANPCPKCPYGKFSGAEADKCTNCGDAGYAGYDQKLWDKTQSELTSNDECRCARSREGTNCQLEVCSATTPVVSLGFLVLEVQWPRHTRPEWWQQNEAFTGISAAFRTFDENDDDYLSVNEARRALRAGGMAVPFELSHIWSKDGIVELNEGDITITEMIEDELARLQEQKTKEFYEQPPIGSGEITTMEATYPNPLTTNAECAAQSTKPPLLEWSVSRENQDIFQQCVFFNGVALNQEDGLDIRISSGGACNDVAEGEAVGDKCSYGFQFPEDYEAPSHFEGKCTEPGTFDYDGRTLHCIEVSDENGERLVDVLEVRDGLRTCRYDDADSCPAGYNIWVPRSYEHAKAVVDTVDASLTKLVGVYGTTPGTSPPPTVPDYAMNSDNASAIAAGWTSVAGSPWFLRNTSYSEPNGNYEAGCWLDAAWNGGWQDGVGFNFDDYHCGYCFTNYLCSSDSPVYLPISKHSYCVETKFCKPGTTKCNSTTADPALTVTHCSTGLQYDGTPTDITPRMMGTLGISISWLYTSPTAKVYRLYKFDPAMPFAADTSARLLREVSLSMPSCGLTFRPDTFRDVSTGAIPGLAVGYAVVPLEDVADDLVELRNKTGTASFIVTWFGNVYVEVAAEGGGPVRGAKLTLSHVIDGEIDEKYRDFVEVLTDDYGEAHLKIRVRDPEWSDLTQHFRLAVGKNSTNANGQLLIHEFEPDSKLVTMQHLEQGTFEFTDTTSRVISGTVSHAGFGAAYFAKDCPHTKSDDGECMCPVDGAKVFIIRASGAEQEVTLDEGKFATSVFEGETVTLGLKQYNGTNGIVPHSFSVSHDASDNATTVDGTEPTFEYTADEDTEVHFLDTSMQTLFATYVVGAGRVTAEYVNGLPVVAEIGRCGWEQPAWALRGVAKFELGAAAVEVRALSDDEVLEAKYYYPPEEVETIVQICDETARTQMVEGFALSPDERMLRGCRLKIPDVSASATPRLPCASMDYTYVDQLPTNRIFGVDLSILGTGPSNATNATNATNVTYAQAPVEFVIASPLCLASVSAKAVTTLQSLLTLDGERESEYALASQESLLTLDELPAPEEEGLYGKACTDNTGAVFRKGDAVGFGFELVEREPNCYGIGIWPWDKNGACYGYKATEPTPDYPIPIRVADGVSKTDSSAIYGEEPFLYNMTAGEPNPFAPFSHELSVEFTRAFDGAEILFVRYALVVGSIPEEVPQVWTVATNPTFIFFVLRDPPGGGSFATLTEGSTISTSMAIDGSHAAELGDSWNLGTSVGFADNIKAGAGWMAEIEKNIFKGGIKVGASYSQAPVDVTVSRATSRHFDVSFTFSTGLSTSTSPYLAGQPSDVIIGGGANLRFISSIEVFATASGLGLCLGGRTTLQFLPEQVSSWVMSVYEIEKTIERIGATLADPNGTKLVNSTNASVPNLEKQIENWQTVLANYREATLTDQAESVADQLSRELDQFQTTFEGFLAEAENEDGLNPLAEDAFKDFLVDGLNELEGSRAAKGAIIGAVAGLPGGPVGAAIGAGVGAAIGGASQAAGSAMLRLYDSMNQESVNRAADECVSAAALADPNGDHRLCDVYSDISKKLELKDSLFGICDFKDGNPSVEAFCKRDHYRSDDPESKVIGAFDALHDTTQFITFSGSTGLDFSWDIAESRGQELTSTHDANVADALGGDAGGGFNIGRRRLESADDRGVPGYAYPISGRVLAVSKKLLEVTPDALEERRRRLNQIYMQQNNIQQNMQQNNFQQNNVQINIQQADTEPESVDNPCRRRLDGLEMSEEERRRLGATMCGQFALEHKSSFAVSLGRAASKDAGHSRSVSIFLGDGNAQDIFAVKISQDVVYGTPIFTTMGGRSSCVGETATTRRDSRVTIEQIKPLCSNNDPADFGRPLCASKFDCECTDLAPGEDAIFSVVIQNLSPWVTSVKYLLRAVNGASTPWDSGKYARDFVDPDIAGCKPGALGSLEVVALGNSHAGLRDGDGIIFAPLNYGQSEVRIRVSRPDFAPQCFSFTSLELELVSVCEDTDWDENQDVYQYRTTMDEKTGEVTVIHPKWNNVTYSFTDDTRARGPDTSKKTFDVSWKNEAPGCMYSEASNYDPAATVDDRSCAFDVPGCVYAAASNYNEAATIDDGSCEFGPQFAPRDVSGGSCMTGVELDSEDLVALYRNMIAKLAGVDPAHVVVDVTEITSCGSNGRRRLASGAFEFTFTIATNPSDTDAVLATMAGITAEDMDAELKNQAAEDGSDLSGVTTESVQDLTVTTATPAPTATAMPTGAPKPAPTAAPTAAPTLVPTNAPTLTHGPTAAPSAAPTSVPTVTQPPTVTPGPSSAPTMEPTLGPTPGPTTEPTLGPTPGPTVGPTVRPGNPTVAPMPAPTPGPDPTLAPTLAPTGPTSGPSPSPSQGPTQFLSEAPTVTAAPTRTETYAPTRTTDAPSYVPTTNTYVPTTTPTTTNTPTASNTVPTTPKGIRRLLRGLGVDGH